jgi:hypothetical protein
LVQIYKYLELNNILANGFFSRVVNPQMTVFVIFCCSTSIFGMLTTSGVVPWYIYGVFPALQAIGTMVTVFVYGEFAKVHSESEWILTQLDKNVAKVHLPGTSRQVRACQVLKIRNWTFQHFTLNTPKRLVMEIINFVLLMLTELT